MEKRSIGERSRSWTPGEEGVGEGEGRRTAMWRDEGGIGVCSGDGLKC